MATDDPPDPKRPDPKHHSARGLRRRATWKRRAIGLGAAAAVLSGGLAVLANLSEIAGWFRPDDTRELVAQTRADLQNTEAKVESLVMLLRNQAAAAGIELDIGSEAAIRNAIEAIVASGNAQKQKALALLHAGDAQGAAEMISRVAGEQANAAAAAGEAAAASWREAGALYYGLDIARAIDSYAEANRLQPGHPRTLEMLGYALLRAGRPDEAEHIFRECLALAAPPDVRADVHTGLGNLARQRGQYGQAREQFERALTTAVEHGLMAERVHALNYLGGLAREEGRLDEAETRLNEALALSETLEDEALEARILSRLGTLAAVREQFPAAEELLHQALQIYRNRNDLGGKAEVIGNLGAVALMRGDADAAEPLMLESVAIGRQLGWTSSIVTDLINLGGIATQRDDLDAADGYLREAGELARQAGLAELAPIIVFNRGDVARARGDIAAACRYWAEAEPPLTAMGSAHATTARGQLAAAECPEVSSESNEQPEPD